MNGGRGIYRRERRVERKGNHKGCPYDGLAGAWIPTYAGMTVGVVVVVKGGFETRPYECGWSIFVVLTERRGRNVAAIPFCLSLSAHDGRGGKSASVWFR